MLYVLFQANKIVIYFHFFIKKYVLLSLFIQNLFDPNIFKNNNLIKIKLHSPLINRIKIPLFTNNHISYTIYERTTVLSLRKT